MRLCTVKAAELGIVGGRKVNVDGGRGHLVHVLGVADKAAGGILYGGIGGNVVAGVG